MATNKKTTSSDLSKKLNISKARSLEAVLKAELISAVLKASKEQELTHAEMSNRKYPVSLLAWGH
jgi:hypothetical protein